MATPTDKDAAVEGLLEAITGKNRRSTIEGNECMTCDKEASTFKDDLSRREYQISGMCQVCQDATFNVGEDEGLDDRGVEGPNSFQPSHAAMSETSVIRGLAYDQEHDSYMMMLFPSWQSSMFPEGFVTFVLSEAEVEQFVDALTKRKTILGYPIKPQAANDPTGDPKTH